MATAESTRATAVEGVASGERRAPRLWPALVLLVIYWIARVAVNTLAPGTFGQFLTLFYSPLLLALGLAIWWLAFSRLPWFDRVWAVGWLILGGGLALRLAHASVGVMAFVIYALPVAATAIVLWQFLAWRWPAGLARIGLVAAAVLAWGYFDLVRLEGMEGNFRTAWSWRWNPTAEEVYLATLPAKAAQPAEAAAVDSPLEATAADWPEFRGPQRDGVVRGVRIAADWQASPPKELWKKRVGPGWSSFAVVGDRAFTQEQRGEEEAVVCLALETGEPVWAHLDQARFWEAVAGAGPRATPTFHAGRIYALGASGKLNCLEAASGKRIWTRDIAVDSGAKPPMWGFASSPLVIKGVVIVIAGAGNGKSVLAYDAGTGEPKWMGGSGTQTYSSAHRWAIGERQLVLVASDAGLEAFDPASGQLAWKHDWPTGGVARIVQPHIMGAGQVLLGTGMGVGTRLLTVSVEGDDWKVAEGWTTKDLKPYYNDFVSQAGFGYGFDGEIFLCIDLSTGKRRWKKGRYGFGQVLLVADQGLLIVLSERGEVVLLQADPEKHRELAKFQAIAGKTWNHPVLARGKLLVRNGEEMACFAVATEGP